MLNEKTYIDLMAPFYNMVKREIRSNGDLTYYGTGEAGHWAIQSNFNVAGALAVLGTTGENTSVCKDEVLELAMKLFRYNLATHQTGTQKCSCGNQWGRSWITVLGLERMIPAQLVMEKFFTDSDREAFRKLRLDEADWLLEGFPTVAGMENSSGRNKPESSFWNGSFLFRTAMDYDDAPNKDAYLEKAYGLLLNAISHPLDSSSGKLFRNKALKDWNVGSNFTDNYSLDHHGYMNVGYSIVTLSHAAYLYFCCKARNWDFPPEAALHVKDLWDVVKNFIFPDGRLLRIGGDTRARYCYCQMYLLPVLLMMEDLYGEKESAAWEKGMLQILKNERSCNKDGSFFGTRLSGMQHQSRFYYTRLESDPFAVLGAGAAIRRSFPLLQAADAPMTAAPAVWSDDFHGADMIRCEKIVRSMVTSGAEGPVALAVPLHRSDMAEWCGNGYAQLQGHFMVSKKISSWHTAFTGGFVNTGSSRWIEAAPWGEGEGQYPVAVTHYACAALPDGKSMVILEKTEAVKEHCLVSLRTAAWKIPNDLHNADLRSFYGENFRVDLRKLSGAGVVETGSRWINVDNELTLCLGYGANSWKINAPDHSMGVIKSFNSMTSLYVNELCAAIENTPQIRRMPGEIIADTAYTVTAGVTSSAGEVCPVKALPAPEEIRAVELTDAAGVRWCFAANFSSEETVWNGKTILHGQCLLEKI